MPSCTFFSELFSVGLAVYVMNQIAAEMVVTAHVTAEHRSFSRFCQVAPICTPSNNSFLSSCESLPQMASHLAVLADCDQHTDRPSYYI